MHVYAEGHRLRSHGHHCCSRAWITLEEHQSSLALEQHAEVRPKVRPLWWHLAQARYNTIVASMSYNFYEISMVVSKVTRRPCSPVGG